MFTVEIHTFAGYVFSKPFTEEKTARHCFARHAPAVTAQAGGVVIENVRLWRDKKELLADARRGD